MFRCQDCSGLQVAAQLEPDVSPLLVFVTAFDAHALSAFDLDAVDYLLKPYDEERFRRSLDRVRERLRAPEHRRSAVRLAREQTGSAIACWFPLATDCA